MEAAAAAVATSIVKGGSGIKAYAYGFHAPSTGARAVIQVEGWTVVRRVCLSASRDRGLTPRWERRARIEVERGRSQAAAVLALAFDLCYCTIVGCRAICAPRELVHTRAIIESRFRVIRHQISRVRAATDHTRAVVHQGGR